MSVNSFLMAKKCGVQVRNTAVLRDYTTFRMGGACRMLVECDNTSKLCAVVRYLADMREEFIVIGEGSNLLVADGGVDATVVRYVSEIPCIERVATGLRVTGGTLLRDLCVYSLERGYSNFSYCVGIPGTVGGAIVGNAGAFGKQLGDELISAEIMDATGQIRVVDVNEMGFTYRDSELKRTGDVLVSALLRIKNGARVDIEREFENVMNLRRERHPDYRRMPTAGSFFRNVEPTSAANRRHAAGWFLEHAGVHGMRVGGAVVFEGHANMIVKENEQCSARDVLELSKLMAQCVKEKFDIELKREVRILGDFERE